MLAQTDATSHEHADNRLIVSFNSVKSIKNINDIRNVETLDFLFSELNLQKIKALDKAYTKETLLNKRPLLFVFSDAVNISNTLERLKKTNLFLYAEPDFINYGSGIKKKIQSQQNGKILSRVTTPNDPYFFRQWAFHNDGTFNLSTATVDADVDMIEAWDLSTGNPNLTMAVMDTGLKMDHPELTGRIWVNSAEVASGTDTDNNNYVDDINGWDFVNDDNNPTDDHGHGTNVTGIATATGNNGIGYAGVDWYCKVMPLKVLNENNSGFTSNIIESFYYAINKGVKIISISIGGSGYSVAYEDAINTAYNNNIVVVACMMNFNNNVPYYPAAFTNTIAIGSTDSNDQRTEPFFWSNTSGSNYGSHIDVIAPGNYMYGLANNSDTNYNYYWGGTSQSTPLVSGICSLMLSVNPNLSPNDIRTILRDTAEDQVGDSQDIVGWDQYYGYGRVNAFNALNVSLSINENTTTQIKLHPNPIESHLNISSNNLVFTNYILYNVLGQKIISGEISNNKIDFSSIKSGVYFIKINTEFGRANTQKIVKE